MAIKVPGTLRVADDQTQERLQILTQRLTTNYAAFLRDRHPDACVQAIFNDLLPKRSKVLANLRQDPDLAHIHDRIAECGTDILLYRNDAGHALCVPLSCKSRYCPRCSRCSLRNRATKAISRAPIMPGKCSFITLTKQQIPGRDLREDIFHVREAWTRLRQDKWWKRTIRGGIMCLEAVPSKTYDNTFHTHLHIIAECGWINPQILDKMWSKALRCEGHCHIERVTTEQSTVAYLSKYITKPVPDTLLNNARDFNGFVHATSVSHRTYMFFGTWHRNKKNTRMVKKETKPLAMKYYELIGGLVRLLEDERWCQKNMEVLHQLSLPHKPAEFQPLYYHPTQTHPPNLAKKETLWNQA